MPDICEQYAVHATIHINTLSKAFVFHRDNLNMFKKQEHNRMGKCRRYSRYRNTIDLSLMHEANRGNATNPYYYYYYYVLGTLTHNRNVASCTVKVITNKLSKSATS